MTVVDDESVQAPALVAGTETEALIQQGPTQKANGVYNRYGETIESANARITRDIPSCRDAHSWLTDGASRLPEAGLWRLIGDLGIVGRTIVRRGHRTPATGEQIAEVFEELFRKGLGVGGGIPIEREYTTLPFADALKTLLGGRSAIQMSRRTGIELTRMKRLMGKRRDGEGSQPTGDEMAAIASTFGKQSWYFREVRSAMVAAMVMVKMDDEPDASARIVRALAG